VLPASQPTHHIIFFRILDVSEGCRHSLTWIGVASF
jgi:hypothetical protein